MEQRLPGLPDHHVLLINKDHPLVQGLIKLNSSSIIIGSGKSSSNKELSEDIARHLYDIAKLSIGGMEPKALGEFQNRSSELMGKLINKAI